MPRRYGADALYARKLRAIRRGFLLARPANASYVAVPRSLVGRIKDILASVVLHASHNELTGHGHHLCKLAAVAARASMTRDA